MSENPSRVRHAGPQANIVAVLTRAYAAGQDVTVVPAGRTKAESLDLFAEVLDFPAHVGRNLDALYDALRDHADALEQDWALIWDAVGELREGDPTAYDGIVSVLADLAEDYPRVHPTVVER